MFRRRRVLDKVVRQKFVVNLKTGRMMSGLLVESDDQVVVLAHVKVQQDNGSWVAAADGLSYLFVADIESMQKVSVSDASQ
ncbi:hypothetical protein [Nocardia africana]